MVEMERKTPVVKVVESCMVVPAAETPKKGIWLSNLDLVQPRHHTPVVYVYRHDGSRDFFSGAALKASLSRALVTFYPFAGRLRVDQDGRLEVACTGDGALFVEAKSESTLDEFGDFRTSDLSLLLVPKADSDDPPLLLVQVTALKCGAVCLGTALHHSLSDGRGSLNLISSWSDLTRGGDVGVPPFLDYTLLRARHPPSVTVDLLAYKHTTGGMRPSTARPENPPFSSVVLNLTKDQIATLKRSCGGRSSPSRFTVVVAHVWRCACMARLLAPDRETRLYMVADARARVKPPLPPGFLGNAMVRTLAAAAAGEVASNPLEYGARKIQEATSRVDDEYVMSCVDFLELQEDVGRLAWGSWMIPASDLWVMNWLGLPLYEADFGWGRPAFAGRASMPQLGGVVYLVDPPGGDGGLAVVVTLEPESLVRFMELFHSDIADMETRGIAAGEGACVV